MVDLRNANLTSSIDRSPDGTLLAYSDVNLSPDQLAIYLLDIKTGQRRKLTSPPRGIWGDWDPKFSPDGTEIAFKRVTGLRQDDIYITSVAGGPERRLLGEMNGGVSGHAWTADAKSLIVSCQRGNAAFGLWRFPLSGSNRAPQALIQGVVSAVTPATNRNTNLLAWVKRFGDFNIYRVSAKGNATPEKLIASTLLEMNGVYSSTSRIAFVSDRSGSPEIWISDADGSQQVRVTNLNFPDINYLQWSHDGRRLAAEVETQSISTVLRLDCGQDRTDCGAPRRLASSAPAHLPSWSADDRFLYFASDQTGRSEIYKETVEGGPIVQVTHNGGLSSCESIDGKWLYFSKPQMEGVWRMPARNPPGKACSADELVIGPPNHPIGKAWTLAGEEVVFIDRTSNAEPAVMRAYNVLTNRMRTIVSLTPFFFEQNDSEVSVSPDLRWVIYLQIDELRSNVMLAEIAK